MRDPAIGEILVQADDLQHRVQELGFEISSDYEGRNLVLVGVLKGAVFFLSDLMRHIEIPCEVDFMAVASYGSATDSSGVVRILKDLDAAIEDRDELQQALRDLSPRARQVIALRYGLDLSLNEIAEVLGCPEGTVKSRLNAALGKLRAIIGEGRASGL